MEFTNGQMTIKPTIFWSLPKAVNPIPFVGNSQKFKLFQEEVETPCVRNKVEYIRTGFAGPVFYQICSVNNFFLLFAFRKPGKVLFYQLTLEQFLQLRV